MPEGCEERTHNAAMRLPANVKDEVVVVISKRADATDMGKAGAIRRQTEDTDEERARREFEFPGALANVARYRDQVMEFVRQYCVDEGDCIDILVAVQEALANAALHGCGDDPAKVIRCTVSASKSDIVIRVQDPGPGFDRAVADLENYQVTKLTHGRGIALIRSLMSEVTFADHGSEIVLRKRIDPA